VAGSVLAIREARAPIPIGANPAAAAGAIPGLQTLALRIPAVDGVIPVVVTPAAAVAEIGDR